MNATLSRVAAILGLVAGSAMTGCISISHSYYGHPTEAQVAGAAPVAQQTASAGNCGCPGYYAYAPYGYQPYPYAPAGYDRYYYPYPPPYYGNPSGGYYPPESGVGTARRPDGGAPVTSDPRREAPADPAGGYDPYRGPTAVGGSAPDVTIDDGVRTPPGTSVGGWHDADVTPSVPRTPQTPPTVPVADRGDVDLRPDLPVGGTPTGVPVASGSEDDTRSRGDLPGRSVGGTRADVPHDEVDRRSDVGVAPSVPRGTRPSSDDDGDASPRSDAGGSVPSVPSRSVPVKEQAPQVPVKNVSVENPAPSAPSATRETSQAATPARGAADAAASTASRGVTSSGARHEASASSETTSAGGGAVRSESRPGAPAVSPSGASSSRERVPAVGAQPVATAPAASSSLPGAPITVGAGTTGE